MERLSNGPIAGESPDLSRAADFSMTPTRRLRSPIPECLSSLASTTTTKAAFFGETGLVGYFQITKHLSASGGYQVMFVNNVAQPVNQLAGMNLANVHRDRRYQQRAVLPRGLGRSGIDVVRGKR